MDFVRTFEAILFPFQYFRRVMGRFFTFGGKLPTISMAAKVAMTLFFLMLAFWLTMVLFGWFSDQYRLPFVKFFVVAPLLIVASTIFCYWGIRLLSFERPSLYPEIDSAWGRLEEWLETEKLALEDVPCYLVLGAHNSQIGTAIHEDQKNLQLAGVPKGENEWLHWWGNEEAIYLHVKQCSTLSALTSRLLSQSAEAAKFGSADFGKTLVAPEQFGQTMQPQDYSSDDTWKSPSLSAEDMSYNQSLTPEGMSGPAPLMPEEGPLQPIQQGSGGDDTASLSDDLLDRLKYVCERFKKANPNHLPVQGILAILPFDSFQSGKNHLQFAEAARDDLLEIQNELQLELPVTVMFGGLERNNGFLKLQQLIGSKAAQTGRFGAGCRLGDLPKTNANNLALLAERACHVFDSWIMNRYQDRSRLSKAMENQDLYRLLFKIRSEFQWRLEQFFTAIQKDDSGQWNEGLSLSGCYFCATGDNRNSRGFIHGVLQKLEEFAAVCGWNPAAIQRERIYSITSSLLLLASLAVLAVSGWTAYQRFTAGSPRTETPAAASIAPLNDEQHAAIG